MKKYLLQPLNLTDYKEILADEVSGGSRPRLTLLNENNHKFFLKSYTKTPRELWVELFASKLWNKLTNFVKIQSVTLKKIPDSILDRLKVSYWDSGLNIKPLWVLIDNAFRSNYEIKYWYRIVSKGPMDTVSMKEVFIAISKMYWFAWLHEELLQSYSDMVVFDALIWNMDRHLENWWILESDVFLWSQMTLIPKEHFIDSVKFTPLFDHWSAGLFELSEEKVCDYLQDLENFKERYILWWKYSLITADNGEPMNIFKTLDYQLRNSPWKKYLKKSITSIGKLTLLDMAEVIFKMPEDRVSESEHRETIEYSRERKELLLQSLFIRQKLLTDLL